MTEQQQQQVEEYAGNRGPTYLAGVIKGIIICAYIGANYEAAIKEIETELTLYDQGRELMYARLKGAV